MNKQNQFTIRPIEPDDLADYHAMLTHPKVITQMQELPTLERIDLEKWMGQESNFMHRLVAVQNGRIVGYTQLDHFANPRLIHSGQLKLMVHPDFWRLGIGTALLNAILNIADNWLNLTRIQLAVLTDNMPAIHLFQKFDFAQTGERKKVIFGNGRFHDDLIMERLRNTHIYDHQRSSPAPQRPRQAQPNATITYRPVQKSDAQGMYQLFQLPAVCRTTLQLPSQELWRSAQRIDNPPPNMVRIVAEDGQKVVGIASILQRPHNRTKHSGGLGMMVHPNYWGMGIGSNIMDKLMESANKWLNLTRVSLEVNVDNPAAVALYRKFGFVIEGTHQFHAYGDGRMTDSYFMARLKEE